MKKSNVSATGAGARIGARSVLLALGFMGIFLVSAMFASAWAGNNAGVAFSTWPDNI